MWLTLAETASALGITRRAVSKLVVNKELGKVRKDGTKIYVHVEVVRKFAVDHNEDVLHRRLCVQNHILLYRTGFGPEVLAAFKRAATRMRTELTVEESKERGLCVLGFYKPRITLAPFSRLRRTEKAALDEFCFTLHNSDTFDRRQIWDVVGGRSLTDRYHKQQEQVIASARSVIDAWQSKNDDD